MTTASNTGKLVAILLVAIVGAAAGYGYFKQAAVMSDSEAKTVSPTTPESSKLLAVKPGDIILGDANALVTIVEYSSLSCSHCAHFHQTVLPTLDKEFITTGKVKIVLRHFPLNAPALKGAMVVECAGQNGLNRANFMKNLFDLQAKWAFDENFERNLKEIARTGGLDSAAYESCTADKDMETRIIAGEKEAADTLKVDGTPAFFIDGVAYTGERTVEGFRTAIKQAMKLDADAIKPALQNNDAPAHGAEPEAAKPQPVVKKAPSKAAEEPANEISSEETED